MRLVGNRSGLDTINHAAPTGVKFDTCGGIGASPQIASFGILFHFSRDQADLYTVRAFLNPDKGFDVHHACQNSLG